MKDRLRNVWHALTAPQTRSAVLWDGSRLLNRLPKWQTPATSANTFFDNPTMLRGRAESEYRNNPYGRKAADALVNGVWGATAINPQFPDRAHQALWDEWADGADTSGRLDWTGLGAEILRTVIVSGEAFVVTLPDANAPRIPLSLQVLGPEYLDTSRNDAATLAGIQYNGTRATGYWIFRQNPAVTVQLQSVFIPAEFCLHIFKPIAPGAQRGQSWLAPVLLPLRELQEYLEASLVRAKTAALFAGFIRTPDGSNPLNVDGTPTLEPGSMTRLQPSEEIEFSSPPEVGITFDPFIRAQLRRIAAGLGVPYEILSGDLSAVTFASGRHGLLEFRRTVEAVQYGLMVPQFCQQVLKRWTRLAVALEVLTAAPQGVRWIGPGIEMLDPRMETAATISRVRAGLCSRKEAVAQTGWRVEDIDAEIAADNARADKLGLVLDSDPRKTTLQGQEQTTGGQAN